MLAGSFFTILLRVYMKVWADQYSAHNVFCWVLTIMNVSALVVAWLIQWRYALVTGRTAQFVWCSMALYLAYALFLRRLALTLTHRWITLLAFMLCRCTFCTATSVLGQPDEGVIVATTLILGEGLGYPLERRWRTKYMNNPNLATVKVAVEQERSFNDSILSSPSFSRASVVLFVAVALLSFYVPGGWPLGCCLAAVLMPMLILIAYLRRMANQGQARDIFSWAVCVMPFSGHAIFAWAQSRYAIEIKLEARRARS